MGLVIGTENGIRVYDLPGRKFIDRYEVVREVDETKVVDPKKTRRTESPHPQLAALPSSGPRTNSTSTPVSPITSSEFSVSSTPTSETFGITICEQIDFVNYNLS